MITRKTTIAVATILVTNSVLVRYPAMSCRIVITESDGKLIKIPLLFIDVGPFCNPSIPYPPRVATHLLYLVRLTNPSFWYHNGLQGTRNLLGGSNTEGALGQGFGRYRPHLPAQPLVTFYARLVRPERGNPSQLQPHALLGSIE